MATIIEKFDFILIKKFYKLPKEVFLYILTHITANMSLKLIKNILKKKKRAKGMSCVLIRSLV